MKFEKFKELALNPPYIEQESVYRVDVHCYAETANKRENETEWKVKLTQSFIYPDWAHAESKLNQIVTDTELKEKLYVVYIYQLPVDKDVSNELYQRLWVYDRNGKLSGQSCCTVIIEDLVHLSAKFRGHQSQSIRFSPGDIVEVYDPERGIVKLSVVVKQPMTIEECWAERKLVEIDCKLEGIGKEFIDDNYWLYADADTFLVVDGPDFENNRSYPLTYDVFPLSQSISPELRQRYSDYYKQVIETINKAQEGNEKCMKRIHALVDLL